MARLVASILVLLGTGVVAHGQWSSEIERGVAWLVSRQRDDGAFAGGRSALPTTARVTLAMLSAGHEPDLGRHGLALRRAIDFLHRELARADDPRSVGDARDRAVLLLSLLEAASIEPDTTRRRRQLESLRPLVATLDPRSAEDRETRAWTEWASGVAARVGLGTAAPATRPAATRPDVGGRAARSLGETLVLARAWSSSNADEAREQLAETLRGVAQRQERDGSWTEGGNDDARRIVATATAILTLSLPARHLPSP